ncbi:MAG: hypothetical protein R3C52_10790 [Hyphomonadaceae bacterium]
MSNPSEDKRFNDTLKRMLQPAPGDRDELKRKLKLDGHEGPKPGRPKGKSENG